MIPPDTDNSLLQSATGMLLALLLCLLQAAAVAADAPRVVVSTKPLHSLLAGLMHGVTEPRLLIENHQAPWDYQPDADDVEAIAAADLVIWTGPELEHRLAPVLAGSAARPVFEVLASDALKVLPGRHDERRRDPFFWLDSRNMLILLDRFREQLAAIDPLRASIYERNARRVAEELSAVDRAMEFGYRDVSGIPVFFYHDTHQYFEQAYAMHVAGSVVAVSGGELADTERLLSTRGALLAVRQACLFTEKGLSEPHLDLLASDSGAVIVELDSFGVDIQPGPELYVELLRNNFAAIAQCVRGMKPHTALSAAVDTPDISRSPDRLNPRYLLRDQFGRSVSHEDFRGQLQLIYFGYTFCPDICPTSLAVMAQALHLLDGEAAQIQPIFITVDPQRDTPELLGEYVKYFHPRMLGLSAGPEITKRTAELFRVRYELVPSESGDPNRYTMDHTASLFLLGRRGEFITKFAHGLAATELAGRLRQHLHD